MKTRRFEHPETDRFWEVYWEQLEAEVTTGRRGTNGKSRRHEFGGPIACKEFVNTEIAKLTKRGFVEVVSEVAHAVSVDPPAEWLARIAASFDDDVPRLVYADWLQTQGDPLGELIVVQCERALLDDHDPKQRALREREDYLLDTHRLRWFPNITGIEVTFRRGFVDRAKMMLPFDRASFEKLVAAAPLVRTLELIGQTETWRYNHDPGVLPWEQPLPMASLRKMTGLFLRGRTLLPGAVRTLVDYPELAAVERLGLQSCGITAPDVEVLARRSWRELDLHDNVLGARGISYLAEQTRLEVLDVGSSGVGDDGAEVLAHAPLRALRRLSLRQSNLTKRSLGRVLNSPNLGVLRSLDLSCNAVPPDVLASCTLPALIELDLTQTQLGDDGALALARSPLAARLVSLDLGTNGMTEVGICALADAEWPALRYLSVSGNAFGKAAAQLKSALTHARVLARKRSAAPPPPPRPPEKTFTVGERVEIRALQFRNFTGVVEAVAPDRRRVRVNVVVLGSPTSIEFGFDEVD